LARAFLWETGSAAIKGWTGWSWPNFWPDPASSSPGAPGRARPSRHRIPSPRRAASPARTPGPRRLPINPWRGHSDARLNILH
jgi:hypothetical protein